jgi:16S rRNA (cytosine1402-N4)-methyltransferase
MHQPVLLNEAIKYLNPKQGENFVDCTTGEAGHACAILERIKPDGKVLGIDIDLDSLKRIKSQDRFILVHGNFKDLKKIVEANNFRPVSGVLFDLGLSSWQIKESGRGFSFKKDEPLNMAFVNQDLTAAQIINKWPEETLIEVFSKYGEEKYSRRIAKQIIKKRKESLIKTTFELREIIEKAIPKSRTRRGQANRVLARIFQALRIVVNDELENLKLGLGQAVEILEPKGRMVVISFHSLEDRIVKNFFRNNNLEILTKKPIRATEKEIKNNPRSRSAKLRVVIKR